VVEDPFAFEIAQDFALDGEVLVSSLFRILEAVGFY
jgi:hypothetical protein